MRRLTIAALFIAAITASPHVSAQTPDDCYQATLRQNDQEIIRICSAALKSSGLDERTRSITVSNRGLGYLRDKQYDQAILDFSDALVLDPRNPYSFNFRGEAWREKGNLDRAFADFSEALRIEPAFTGAIYNRGVTFERQGDVSSARAEYRKAVTTNGDSALDKWARDRSRERLTALGEGARQPQQPRNDERSKRENERIESGRGSGGRDN
jgi:Tfp pilus assembly protein PilF